MALKTLWQRLGFRAKLIWSGVLLQILMLATVGLGAYVLVDRYLQQELQARVGQLKPLFNAALSAPLVQRDYATVAAILAETRVTRDLVFICVRDVEGRVIAEERADGKTTALGSTGLKQTPPATDASATFDFQAALEIGGQALGQVEFGLSRRALAETRESLLWALALVGLVGLFIFSALLAALSHALTKPLTALMVAARDIHAANYDVEFDPERKDELGVLMKAFSRMGLEVRRKVTELMNSEVLQRKYLQEAMRRQTETQLALQAAEAANAAKTDFIANMSHEIRTPMNSIVGYADMLLRTPLNADQQEYTARLQNASSTLLGVVNNVLDFSKIEAGQLKASAEPFDLVAALDNVAGLFQPQLRDRAVRLRLDIDPDLPRWIAGDALRLHQVLVNLVGNAVKFTEEGEVRLLALCPLADMARPLLRIRVSDTGIGIEPAQIDRIFSPFAQADGSITRRFGGTGLGLSISRRLVELMGGTLSVRSEPGQGSEFTLEIPFERVDAAQAEAASAASSDVPRHFFDSPALGAREAPTHAADPAGAMHTPDPATLVPLLNELDDLLSRNMMGARRVAERLRAELHGSAWADPFAAIEQDVRRLRFREARSGLKRLKARWDEASSGIEQTLAS